MVDFQFLQNPLSKKWVILAPRRAKRPDVASGVEPVCPFCPGRERNEPELYRVPSENFPSAIGHLPSIGQFENSSIGKSMENGNWKMDNSSWLVRVIPNKFPFAPTHEIIIHSPDHDKNFGDLPDEHVALILKTYRQRYLAHFTKGEVYIFHNRGEKGGESLPHAHTQLAVVPFGIKTDTPRLDSSGEVSSAPKPLTIEDQKEAKEKQNQVITSHFYIFCPKTSQWPDEVWVAPQKRGRAFGEITDDEISDLAHTMSRLIQIFNLRHGPRIGGEFPYNFYIYPGGDWYLRIIPRLKTIGGFELSSGIFVNTQDPLETLEFIKEHFESPNEEKIKREHQADYHKAV